MSLCAHTVSASPALHPQTTSPGTVVLVSTTSTHPLSICQFNIYILPSLSNLSPHNSQAQLSYTHPVLVPLARTLQYFDLSSLRPHIFAPTSHILTYLRLYQPYTYVQSSPKDTPKYFCPHQPPNHMFSSSPALHPHTVYFTRPSPTYFAPTVSKPNTVYRNSSISIYC